MREPQADYWWNLYDQMRHHQELDQAREELMQAAILTGSEITLFGRKCRLYIEWLEEPPMTDEQLRGYGEKIRASAIARSEKASATP